MEERIPCPRCGGTGEEAWEEAHTCPDCGGVGGFWSSFWDGEEHREDFLPCGTCGGGGSLPRWVQGPCSLCQGRGWVYAREVPSPLGPGCLVPLLLGLLALLLLGVGASLRLGP